MKPVEMEKKGRVTVEEHGKVERGRDDGRSRLNPIPFFFSLFPNLAISTHLRAPPRWPPLPESLSSSRPKQRFSYAISRQNFVRN